MKPFEKFESVVVPLDQSNVDTDQIVPKQFLKRVERSGFGKFLFYDWRYNADESDNTEFIMNKPEYRGAKILAARENFGCGSSREHAPWALLDYGFQVIIAESFADIFYNNCFQNGILPVQLPASEVETIFQEALKGSKAEVDLEDQKISIGGKGFSFDIEPTRKNKLLKGLDDISWTLQYEQQISDYEGSHTIYA